MKKILIVDDDPDILEIVSLLLTRYGFIVETIPGGRQIKEAIQSFQPDVILLDINMDGIDGRELCKQLKSVESIFRHIPVILFSAIHNLKETYAECEATDFISKPFDTSELIEKIKKHSSATS